MYVIIDESVNIHKDKFMGNIRDNIAAAKEARAKLRAHCMAFRITETETHLLVIFPTGYRLDGVRVSMTNGIAWACEKALEKMEHVWGGGA